MLSVGSISRPIVAEVAAPVTPLTANQLVTRTVTVGGLLPEHCVVVNWPALDTGLAVSGVWVSAINTLSIRLFNTTGGTVTPAAASLKVVAL